MRKETLWRTCRRERREAGIKSAVFAIILAVFIVIGTENIYLGIASAGILFVIFWGLGVITSLMTLILHQLAEET